jgi:hypothetical protein
MNQLIVKKNIRLTRELGIFVILCFNIKAFLDIFAP